MKNKKWLIVAVFFIITVILVIILNINTTPINDIYVNNQSANQKKEYKHTFYSDDIKKITEFPDEPKQILSTLKKVVRKVRIADYLNKRGMKIVPKSIA